MRSFVYLQYYPEMEVATKEQEGEKAAKEREKQGRPMVQWTDPTIRAGESDGESCRDLFGLANIYLGQDKSNNQGHADLLTWPLGPGGKKG